MASIVRIKRSATGGDPASLATGELAYSNLQSNVSGSNGGDKLYIGHGAENAGNAAVHEVIGGKYFTSKLDHAIGVLTGSSAILVDSDKKIDVLNVDNLTLNLNTISSTNSNGNINLIPNGSGEVVAANLKVSDLTDNRIVISGAAGNIEDDATFTFDGQTLTVGSTTIEKGSTGINTTGLEADSATIGNFTLTSGTFGTAKVTDLTNNRIVIAGASGELEDDANLTFDGSTFTVNTTTINQTGSTINQTGSVNITGDLDVDNLNINGNKIISTNTNGNIELEPNGLGSIEVFGAEIKQVGNATDSADAVNLNTLNQYNNAQTFNFRDDANDSDALIINSEMFNFIGGTGLTTSKGNNTITHTLDNTAVSAGSYGNATNIPSFTVDAQGRLTAASQTSVATTLNLTADSASTGAVSILTQGLKIIGGEGLDVNVANQQFVISGENAAYANKGIASFDNTDFTVTNGAVAVNATTLGSTAINPGQTTTAIAGMTQLDVDNVRLDGNIISTTDSAASVMFLDPGNNNAVAGKVVIRGDLQIDGVTTTVNSTTLAVADKNIVLADGAADSAASDGAGLTVEGSGASIIYNSGTNAWDMNRHVNITSGHDFKIGGVGFDERVDDRLNSLLLAGEAIDLVYNDGSNSLTISSETATASNLGVSKFNTANFAIASGDVTVTEINGGTY